MISFFLMISWQTQFVQNYHSTYAWVLDYRNAVLKMTLFNAMLFFLLFIVTLNLLNNPIQMTFIKYLLYSPEVHVKLQGTFSMHTCSFPPSVVSLSVNMPMQELSCGISVGITCAWDSLEDLPPPGVTLKQWGINLADKHPISLICSEPIPRHILCSYSEGPSRTEPQPIAVTHWLRHTSLVFLLPHLTVFSLLLVEINCAQVHVTNFAFEDTQTLINGRWGRKTGRRKLGKISDAWDKPWKIVKSQMLRWKGLNQEYKEAKAWTQAYPERHLEFGMCQSSWSIGWAEGRDSQQPWGVIQGQLK